MTMPCDKVARRRVPGYRASWQWRHPARRTTGQQLGALDAYRAQVLDATLARRFAPSDRAVERIVRCVIGLFLFGLGITLLIRADLGAAPWDVFHTGVSELTGIGVGPIIVITGVLLLLLWIPLRELPGLGTVLNALLIGVFVDLTMPIVGSTELLVARFAMMIGGVVLIGIGSGFYIGAGLGPGPRDGLMTGLSKRTIAGRRISIRLARTSVELTVLVVGVLMGGAIGVGTAAFTFGIGPLVQIFLPRLQIRPGSPVTTTPLPPSATPRS
ncbi:MAG: YczE/YyaS/YitT family protein [Ilumatobacter sp.]|uniref:membrane protein YczE n=1 Tax=Ilumatobacter sp. TaxID=1967498 RepID=UPI0039189173